MPSVAVHIALAGLVGTALLGDRFTPKAILLVMILTAALDADTLIGLFVPGAHRTLLHNVWLVAVLAAALVWDGRYRDRSVVRERWGAGGYRIAWVALAAMLFVHILLDAFYNGANLFWPLQDRFYDLSGELLLTDQRGVVQTFIELDGGSAGVVESISRGTTDDVHYATGFNPTREKSASNVERVFPVAGNGERLVLVVTGFATVLVRTVEHYRIR
ncbi:metal-dependent hydrolase [Natrinema salifodinae]|uniref:LexA-binding, inner membrane-associated putative hydrolase n=1 Tax=Natrinema salifodinae TaxID=1202768 RepID=A0A1I0MAQ3_9EURY|nr:metal-dependent hydrolase [Natrinema salifodinae]SEV85557.1 LexA-binding, inner membrane-associated putative hydrolase [Natrinema salifodinae]